MGIAEPPADNNGPVSDFLHLAYSEVDRDVTHIFKIHKDMVDAFVDLVRGGVGKKIQIAGAHEMPKEPS